MTAPRPTTDLAAHRALHPRLRAVLDAGGAPPDALADAVAVDERDRLLSLLELHDLHLAPIDHLGPAARLQHHPVLARLRARLEETVLADLAHAEGADHIALPEDPVAAMRAVAAVDQVPDVYRWLAEDASWDELVAFLSLEGGPDAGFDDLVAMGQVGITGRPKVEMARNYWDEMGRGTAGEVHTELHHRLTAAVEMPLVARTDLPVEALSRSALCSVLATNRWLQPELVGLLGLVELQAGPRCRKVVQAMERLGAPAGALGFYVEHAIADPRHGKGWLDEVVGPLGEDPTWAAGMVRGACWRALVNRRFFAAMAERFVRTAAGVTHRHAS
jgi:hypothetical protein